MNSEPNPSNRARELEPIAGSARAPVWLFVLVAMLGFLSMGFLDNHGGGFDPRVYRPYKSIDELGRDQPATRSRQRFIKGQVAFNTYCASCHMKTGLGNPGNRVPPLVHSEWVLAERPNRLIRIVLNGLQGPVKVDGKDFDSSSMIPWRDTLSDDEIIAQILTFIRGNAEWGHNASEISREQVDPIRAETRDRARQWTVDELLNVPEQ